MLHHPHQHGYATASELPALMPSAHVRLESCRGTAHSSSSKLTHTHEWLCLFGQMVLSPWWQWLRQYCQAHTRCESLTCLSPEAKPSSCRTVSCAIMETISTAPKWWSPTMAATGATTAGPPREATPTNTSSTTSEPPLAHRERSFPHLPHVLLFMPRDRLQSSCCGSGAGRC